MPASSSRVMVSAGGHAPRSHASHASRSALAAASVLASAPALSLVLAAASSTSNPPRFSDCNVVPAVTSPLRHSSSAASRRCGSGGGRSVNDEDKDIDDESTLAAMAGYSGTPLAKKLGIKEGARIALVGAAATLDSLEADLGPLPDGVDVRRRAGKADVAVAFFTERAELAKRIEALARNVFPDGGLWIAWPKKSSGVATDITEQTIRDVALPLGVVDNKVCAIDDTWSGLRLVIRRELRDEPPRTPRRASARSTGR